MNGEDSEYNFSLIPTLSRELAVRQEADNRILGEMVESSLALARQSAVAPIDLDALVREGKGLYCSDGYGMTPENIRAFDLFLRAGEDGHSEAQYLTHECYWDGNGVHEDRPTALKWLHRSAEQDYRGAQAGLGLLYEHGVNVLQDAIEAVYWYKRAAEQGKASDQLRLGNCYRDGIGVSRDSAEAVKWWRRAAEQGDPRAQDSLAHAYANGEGVPQDQETAAEWHQRAIDQERVERGKRYSEYILGWRCRDGKGVEVDSPQAYAWLQLAADQGDEWAQEEASALATLMSPREFQEARDEKRFMQLNLTKGRLSTKDMKEYVPLKQAVEAGRLLRAIRGKPIS